MESKKKILLIDDDPTMHDLAKAFLERVGYDCIFANDGYQGLKKVLKEKPDLILLDYMMPGIDGGEVYAQLISDEMYASCRDIPVIMLTAREHDPFIRNRLLEGGMSAYLHKPFGLRELKNVIENVLVTREISLRNKQLQKEIEETKNYLELLVDNAPVGIFSADIQGKIVKANSVLGRMLEVEDPQSLTGINLLENGFLGHPELVGDFAQVLREGQAPEPKILEYKMLQGKRMKLHLRCVPLMDAAQQTTGLIAIIRDITEIEERAYEMSMLSEISQAMQGHLELEELLHLILTCITAGSAMGFSRAMIFLLSEDGRALIGRMGVGPASPEDAGRIWSALAQEDISLAEFLEKYGKKAPESDDAFNNLVRQIRHPLGRKQCVLNRTVREKRAFKVTQASQREDVCPSFFGKLRAEEFVAVPLIAEDHVLGVVVADNLYGGRPIDDRLIQLLTLFANQAGLAVEREAAYADLAREKTKLEEAYLQLQEAQDRLIQAERLATVGKLAAQVTHEIRNPLVTIGGFARSILKSGKDDELNLMANIIAEETSRLEQILSNVLSFTRLSKPKPAWENLNQIIKDACLMVKDEVVERGVSVEKNLDLLLPRVYLDRQQIKQVLLNLLHNALDSMPNGGQLNIHSQRDGEDKVRVQIKDSGEGIPSDVLENMFNPFFTTKPDGTGLGLSITQQIINGHGGSIRVESTVGKGAIFTFTLPVKNDFGLGSSK